MYLVYITKGEHIDYRLFKTPEEVTSFLEGKKFSMVSEKEWKKKEETAKILHITPHEVK